jgi:hypothetical protein
MDDWKQKLIMRLPAGVLLAATLLFWGLYDRYEAAGPALLDAPALADASRMRGDCTETNGMFRLKVVEGGKTAALYFRMPAASGHKLIRMRGRIRVQDVVRGKSSWNRARILLVQYDANNNWVPCPHNLADEEGSTEWAWHEEVFEIQPETAHVDASLQQTGKSGLAWFEALQVEPVQLRASFVWWRMIFAVFWIGLGVFYFRYCRLHRRKLRLLILLNVLAIFAGALMPEKWIEGSAQYARKMVVRAIEEKPVPPPNSRFLHKPIKKTEHEQVGMDRFNDLVGNAHQTGHFLLFASLCFLVYWSAALERQHASYYFKVAFDLLLFAAISESLQHLTLDRTAGVRDWLTDVQGMAAAFSVFVVMRLIAALWSRSKIAL